MIKLVSYTFLALFITAAFYSFTSVKTIDLNSSVALKKTPFEIELKLEQIDAKQYYVIADLALKGDDYIISPYSDDDTYLPFSMTLTKTAFLKPINNLLEDPASVAEYDPILEQMVRLVRGKTIYKQKVLLNTNDDFDVSGMIELLIEPQCIPYHIDFTIHHQSGNLSIKKTKTGIPSYYKGNH